MALSKLSPDSEHQLNKFRNQYLQLRGNNIIYPGEEFLRDADFQDALYSSIFQDGVLKYPPPKRYQLRVLKELLRRIEESITDWEEQDLSDNLMTSLTTLISQPLPSESTSDLQKSYVTYSFPSFPIPQHNTGNKTYTTTTTTTTTIPSIVLLEYRNLLSSAGTTGLRTWESSLHLSIHLLNHPSLVSHKTILELGSGLGLLSILCTKYLDAAHTTCTDGSPAVLSEIPTNLYLNSLHDSPKISSKELTWGQALLGTEEAEWNEGRKVDVVLGADLIYDGDGSNALLATLGELFEMFPAVTVMIAQIVRNRETLEWFLQRSRESGFLVETVEWDGGRGVEEVGPFYEMIAPIELLTFARRDER